MKDKDDNKSNRKFCPECGTKTLQFMKGFKSCHCTKCGYFFEVDRKLYKPEKGVDVIFERH